MFQQQHFTYHGQAFTIEAEGWPTEESASAAMIDLQTWAIGLEPEETAVLHGALEQEREALIHEIRYDRGLAPLPAVQDAQRRAVQTGLKGQRDQRATADGEHRGVPEGRGLNPCPTPRGDPPGLQP